MNQLKDLIKPYVVASHGIVKDFLLSDDFEEYIDSICSNYYLNDEEKSVVADIVCMILIGIIEPNSLKGELLSKLPISPQIARDLMIDIQSVILEPIAKSIDPLPFENNSGVVNSFEKTILNKAMAMRPVGLDTEQTSVEAPQNRGTVPPNLPTEERGSGEVRAIHNYIGESDPYREPIG